MKRISVLIPTAGQPDLLRCALRGIAKQTAISEIAEVIVAENLGDVRSRSVCREFENQLPIQYILRDPPGTPSDNFIELFGAAKAEFVAFVCDDDWWSPGHLQAALADLDQHPNAVVRFCAPLFFVSEMPSSGWVSRPPALWLAAGRPDLTSLWEISPEQVAAASVLVTPFHISSMVVRSQGLARVAPTLSDVSFYQIDRVLFLRLVEHGGVVYEPTPDTFVRWRPDNVTNSMELALRDRIFREVTELAITTCTAYGVDAISTWRRHVSSIDAAIADELGPHFRRAMDEPSLRANGFARFAISRRVRFAKKAARLGKDSLAKLIGR